jgi:predicted Zn-dependent protease
LPGHPNPYLVAFNLVLAHLKAGDFTAAITAGEKMVEDGHRKGEIYNLLSQAYEGNRETLKAYEALRKATEIEPRNETNYLDLITLCLEHQNYDLGLEIADIGLRVVPESDRLRLHRGVVLAMRGQFPEAQQEFETVGKQSSQPGLSHVALSLVLMQAGEIEQAVVILRQRRQENPDDHLALWFLAESLIRQGAAPGSEPENEAVECLERSIQLNPNLAQTRTLLGKTLLGRGEFDRADEQLEKALEIDPEDIAATYQLARVKQRKGDRQRAQELFAKVSKAKEEDRDGFTQGGLLRIVRQGSN